MSNKLTLHKSNHPTLLLPLLLRTILLPSSWSRINEFNSPILLEVSWDASTLMERPDNAWASSLERLKLVAMIQSSYRLALNPSIVNMPQWHARRMPTWYDRMLIDSIREGRRRMATKIQYGVFNSVQTGNGWNTHLSLHQRQLAFHYLLEGA